MSADDFKLPFSVESLMEEARKRTNGRSTKHQVLRGQTVKRFHCSQQRSISLNKIAKR